MKKILILMLSIYVLSACKTAPLNEDGADDTGLDIRYSESDEPYNKAADVNTQLGAGYIGNGNYERAMLKLNKAIEIEPGYATAHNYLGVLYGRLERPNKARQQFKMAMKLAPGDSSIMNNYAVFLCDQKEYDKARQMFKKVLNNPLYNNRANAYESAAWCSYGNDNLPLSEELYRKALDLNANSPRSLLGLARVNYKSDSYEYAWSYFKRYNKASEPDADALWLGVNILNELNDPDLNLLSSFKLQLKGKYPDSDETKWLHQGKQEY